MATQMFRLRFAALLGLAALVTLPGAAGAINRNWNLSGSGGDAAIPGNWSPVGAPVAADSLFFSLATANKISWDATVGASTCQTYRAGNNTLQFIAPHFISGALRIGLLTGEISGVFQTKGVLTAGASCTMGGEAGAVGQLVVSGSNVLFQVQNAGSDVFVGQRGAGNLSVSDGGLARVSDDLILGNFAGSNGTVDVVGASALNASTLETEDVNGDVFVGNLGSGVMNVSSGGVLTSADDLFMAVGTASVGTMTVGGAGAIATVKDVCQVSNNGIAASAPGTATINANVGGSVLVRNELRVGDPDGGTGTLHVNGGLVHTRKLTLDPTHGVLTFDGGTLRIDGGTATITTPASFSIKSTAGAAHLEVIRGAAVTVTNNLFLAAGGTGTILVDSGASLMLPATLFITSGNNTVIVDSASTMTAATSFDLGGSSSTTSLLVDHGSTLNVGIFESADEGGAVATINLQGTGSKLLFGGPLFLAGDAGHAGGSASMTISNGGSLAEAVAGAGITIYPAATLHVFTGGSVQTTGTVDVQGVLDIAGGSPSVTTYSLAGNGRIQGNGTAVGRVVSTVATSRVSAIGGNLTVGNAASTTGFDCRGTVEAGANTLTLRDSNGILLGDSTTVDGGTLASAFTLQNPAGSFVGATGTLAIPKLINSGVLALRGANPGTLAINGGYTQDATATMRLRIQGATAGKFDRVAITGAITFGGALELVFDPNGAYPSGVPITILTFGSRVGTFPTLIVSGVNPAAFTLVYTTTSLQVVFNQSIAVEPGAEIPSVLAFTGRVASGGRPGSFDLALPLAGEVHVAMYDVRGREVARLADGAAAAGIHRYLVPAGTARGVYFGRALVRGAPAGAPDAVRTARVVVR